MAAELAAGALAGGVFGYVLQRGQHCFHATFRGALEHRWGLAKAWLLAVAIGAVGLALVYTLSPWDQLSRGLAFRPVDNVVGGLVFGAGMAVAASCVSGLWYKLGAGMIGAGVGLAAWAVGDVVGSGLPALGPTLLPGGDAATVPGVLGLPRLAVAGLLLLVVLVLLARTRRDAPTRSWQWSWPLAGSALGLGLVVTWLAAGAAGTGFGASTTGAASGLVAGSPAWWRIAFLVAIVVGAALAAGTAGGWWLRSEHRSRYAGLLAGGFLLGLGAQVAGGCNLGHALSGVAQMNVSSLVVVAAMTSGIAGVRRLQRRAPDPSDQPRASA
ncbi:hypothetical protein ER308_01300 [Egibacter rhizosphaerae]|uniref:Uncharacterized protein n=1 Tax=Egibacter rhizosphaerae TaxID=1670831 RepID=A0A411YAU5_9ACTN|nr:YeeE/YedE thiosulfate transporter family protein [Egibacter rhizosphaerae]QBI18340.1 hypothetical protein ER308_01300 [Egibacter rhizosphaerae]